MRYKTTITYKGTAYVGWQRQLNGLSVQEVLEGALSKLFQMPISATASGRTDAGVHAEGQVVHFDSPDHIPEDKMPYAINALLPDDISVLSCERAEDDFNARFSAKRKTYTYRLYTSRQRRPLLNDTHAHIVTPLDLRLMREAADIIEGTHDFKCFEASGSVVKSTVRTVFKVEISAKSLDGTPFDGDILTEGIIEISVTGNGFLYNMVRIIAGTLVYCGTGKLSVEQIRGILLSGDRTLAGKTMPPEGLTLTSVEYF
jgi:tRNA pseudouridine38-40 synthase